MIIRPLGDSAVLVVFGEEIREDLNALVRGLARAIEGAGFEWLAEVVPAYSSLAVFYDPSLIGYDDVRRIIEGIPFEPEDAGGRLVEVPVKYGGEFGPDLGFVAEHNGLSEEEVVEIHSSRIYKVYFIGFLPGFPYLSEVDERIAAPRLERPRLRVPAGSVGIAGRQTGIYPVESPGGWRIIGRTPLKLFDPSREPPVLLRSGDRVKFIPVEEWPHD
ncbi:5-oxoprolinase subunit PxpB [Pyrococcus yayanosii]|uniref:Allophanate hydrolase subunit 1 n=1 Tax=Pyrococcus yayanosii (strain CH1 / JCM 16557) TaxID=529709 RepID=F8AHK8_PYRYC|nr:5-oxoprolinase subunit PxpB [Pyrococcus yayanosii]AEH25379.1 Allophanate hydrolase subunit 1 [Pyrococcus yayanosii CH1]